MLCGYALGGDVLCESHRKNSYDSVSCHFERSRENLNTKESLLF